MTLVRSVDGIGGVGGEEAAHRAGDLLMAAVGGVAGIEVAAQRGGEGGGVLESALAIPCQCLAHDVHEGPIDEPLALEVGDVGLKNRVDDVEIGLARIARPQREQLVEHDASGKDVDAVIDAGAARERRLDLLGSHVAKLALHLARLGGLEAVTRAGDAEVDHLHLTRHRQQDILRADIAVDDAGRLAALVTLRVRSLEAFEDLAHDVAGKERIEALALFFSCAG